MTPACACYIVGLLPASSGVGRRVTAGGSWASDMVARPDHELLIETKIETDSCLIVVFALYTYVVVGRDTRMPAPALLGHLEQRVRRMQSLRQHRARG
jgi:hypothetical protein